MFGPYDTTIDEVTDGIYRISTFLPDAGLGFNQFLIDAEEPVPVGEHAA